MTPDIMHDHATQSSALPENKKDRPMTPDITHDHTMQSSTLLENKNGAAT